MKRIPKELKAKWNEFVKLRGAHGRRYDSQTYTDADFDPNSTASESPAYDWAPSVFGWFNRSERRMLERFGYIRADSASGECEVVKDVLK